MEALRFFLFQIEGSVVEEETQENWYIIKYTNMGSYYFPPTFHLKFRIIRPIRRQRIRFRGVRLYYRK